MNISTIFKNELEGKLYFNPHEKRNIEICFNISTVWTNRLAYVKRLTKLDIQTLVPVLLYSRLFLFSLKFI